MSLQRRRMETRQEWKKLEYGQPNGYRAVQTGGGRRWQAQLQWHRKQGFFSTGGREKFQ